MRFFLRVDWSKNTDKSRRPEHFVFRSPLERTLKAQEVRLEDPEAKLRFQEEIDLHERGVRDEWYEGSGSMSELDDCE